MQLIEMLIVLIFCFITLSSGSIELLYAGSDDRVSVCPADSEVGQMDRGQATSRGPQTGVPRTQPLIAELTQTELFCSVFFPFLYRT